MKIIYVASEVEFSMNPIRMTDRANIFVELRIFIGFESESKVIDWIYEAGELDFLPSANVKEFVKNRFNNSLAAIGLPRIFEVSEALLEETDWFDNEVIATKHVDFFQKRSINYNKRSARVTSEDLF